jgi:hypothetical protein
VFDTDALLRLLAREREKYYWVDLGMRPVAYSVDSLALEAHCPKLFDAIDQLFRDLLDHKHPALAEDPFKELLMVAPFFKHQGFYEEREVRIVAAPANFETLEVVRREHKDFTPPPFKAIHKRHGALVTTPYLALFEDTMEKLPIKRVIVGPSRRQRENHQEAADVLGSGIPLIDSETPFIGR